jgi:O-antigen ligase
MSMTLSWLQPFNLKTKLMEQRGGSDTKLWPALIAALLALSWIQPHHYFPIPGFHKEAWAACWFAACLFVATVQMRSPARLGWMPIAMSGMAVWVWIQWTLGLQASASQALMASTTLVGASLIWAFAQHIHSRDGNLVLDTLMMAVGIAGLTSVGLCLYQFFDIGRPSLAWIDIWIMRGEPGSRPAANMAQPNQLATLFSWAWVAGLWAWYRGKVSLPALAFYLCFVALGQGMAQSRIGLLQSLLIFASCLLWMRSIKSWRLLPALCVGLLVQLGVFFFLEQISQIFLLTHLGRDVQSIVHDQARLAIYTFALKGIALNPWLGWGVQEVYQLQWAFTEQLPSLHIYITFAHNLVLDLMVWLGIPLALVVLLALGIWLLQSIKRTKTPTGYIAQMAIGAFLLHSLVEFPHWGTNLLLWAVALAGVWSAEVHTQTKWSVSKGLSIFLALVVLCVATLSWSDYLRLEENFRVLRAEQTGLAKVPTDPQPTWVMHHLQETLRFNRLMGRPGTTQTDLDWMERTVVAGPNYGAVFTLITSLALAGEHERAKLWMARLDSVAPKDVRDASRAVWKRYQTWYPAQLGNFKWVETQAVAQRKK